MGEPSWQTGFRILKALKASDYRSDKHEQLQNYRWIFDLVTVWLPIAVAILVVKYVSIYFFPLALICIGNRQYASAIVAHDGVHGLLCRNQKMNDWLARYLFYFPIFASMFKYRTRHLYHHRLVGLENDPDRFLYQDFPMSFEKYLMQTLKQIVSGQLIISFAEYFTEIPEILRQVKKQKKWQVNISKQSDFFSYIFFILFVLLAVTYFSIWKDFFMFWLLPLFFVFPVIHFQNALHHGAIEGEGTKKMRSFVGAAVFVEWIMPKHLNFHIEHHLNERVPHYNLPAYSECLIEKKLIPNPDEHLLSIWQTLQRIFSS